jgi:crossover junction endodeoxyribonuclease RuvC
MRIIGIDPGVCGAVAVLDDGYLLYVVDMPTLEDGPKGRRTINAPLLAEIIARPHAEKAFVEKVGTRPGEGAVGSFSFGRGVGIIEGICAALDLPVEKVTPQSWRKYHGLSKEAKDASRSKVISMWPAHADWFARRKDDGRAEACLVALAGIAK